MHKNNIKLVIQYEGTKYFGWQRLGNDNRTRTIQGLLEEKLSDLLHEEIKLVGSGRTDAGVHALGQVANFYSMKKVSLQELKQKINKILPEDIQIIGVEKVSKTFHSRYDAKSKIYEYYIDTGQKQNVFKRRYTTHLPGRLDLWKMKQAADLLIGVHDFKGFSSEAKESRDTVREIYEIYFREEGMELIIGFHGNGFLYNMIRIMVGTLVEIGLGKKDLQDIKEILTTRNRELAGPTMGSQGLFLKNVIY